MSISCIGRPRLEYSSGHPTGNPGGAEGDAVFAGHRRLGRRCSSNAYPPGIARRWAVVTTLWPEDLKAIAENKDARRIFLRMAALSRTGRTPSFVAEVALDNDLDSKTKGQVIELAQDESFLLAVENYLVRAHRSH